MLCGCVAFAELSADPLVRAFPIEVESLRAQDWVRMTLAFEAFDKNEGHDQAVPSIDEVELSFYVCFGRPPGSVEFFSDTLCIPTLLLARRYEVDFFLPKVLLERKRLETTPYAHWVQFSHGGKPLPFHESHASVSVREHELALIELRDRACAIAPASGPGILRNQGDALAEGLRRPGAHYPCTRKLEAVPSAP
jgi:hypothetical protein